MIEAEEKIEIKGVTTLEVKDDMCKYPVHSAGREHILCGEKVRGRSPYCDRHRLVCYEVR